MIAIVELLTRSHPPSRRMTISRDMANWKSDALACPREAAEPLSVEVHK
jgi:hypothetical protein